MDIVRILEEKRPEIDRIIEKWIPRVFDEKSMEFICGKPRYKFNTQAPTKAISEPIWEFLDRGGKRWRPALFLLVLEALGADPEKYKDFVLVPEIIHNGSLIHDDIEDSADLRRGLPCTYKTFGIDIAINAGSVMYFLPMIAFLKNKDLDERTKKRIYETYFQEMINIHFGQAMDIAWHKGIANADNITEEEYLQMCAFKTGTLARLSAKLAAILAGAPDDVVEKIGKFAETIGVAFQIQDDVLDIIADRKKFGKSFGNDIKEGKRTLMVIHTLRKASEEDRRRLLEILNMHTDDEELKKEAIEILKKYGSVEYAKEFSRKLIRETWNEIDKLLPESEAKKKLKAFVDFLVEREY
ncbi:MAG: polyprenyl synthetase family protein [Candidatus Micrarchaeota archaeon]|nr:polyprenyl synthetase family protein [Candidatus Micrarchaeota archaeon]